MHVGVQRRVRRFWLKGHQAKAQHMRSISAHSHELGGRAVPTNDGSQDCAQSVRLLLPALCKEAVSDHLILISPGPESHQIEQTAPESFCYSPLRSGCQHLTLYYKLSAL